MVFLGFVFFEVLVLLWFVFGVFGIVPGVLKMFVFPSFWGFSGVASSCLFLGLEGLGVFVFLCVSCVCFWCLCCFCFCFVCFVFVLLLDCFWCWFLVCFCFCFSVFFFFLFFCSCFFLFLLFLLFCFFGRFKGQVRWPKGPPHLALNPPYFLFLFFVLFFVVLFFWRV